MGYARNVLATWVVRVLLVPVGLVISVVTARWLGPERLGQFAAIGTVLAVASQLGNLGLSLAATRFAAAHPEQMPALVSNARWSGGVIGLAAIGVIIACLSLFPQWFGDVPAPLLVIALVALPMNLVSAQLQALLLGAQRVTAYNALEVLSRVLLLVATVVTLVILGTGLAGLLVATVILAVVQLAAYHVPLAAAAGRVRPDLTLLRRMSFLSGKIYVASLFAFLVMRSDVLLVNALAGAEATGLYAIVVRMADWMLLLPALTGALLFPRVAATGDRESVVFTAAVARHIVAFTGVACVVLAVLAPALVPLLFGSEYALAVGPLWLLLPGIWCFSLQSIISNDLGGRDFPMVLVGAWALTFAVNLGLNVLWIPRYGIAGAALASTAAYTLALMLVTWHWLRRFPEVSMSDLLVLRGADVRALSRRVFRTAGGG